MADLARGSPARRNSAPAAAPLAAAEDARDSARVSRASRRNGTSVSAGRPSGSADAMAARAFAAWRAHLSASCSRHSRRSAATSALSAATPLCPDGEAPADDDDDCPPPGPRTRERSAATAPDLIAGEAGTRPRSASARRTFAASQHPSGSAELSANTAAVKSLLPEDDVGSPGADDDGPSGGSPPAAFLSFFLLLENSPITYARPDESPSSRPSSDSRRASGSGSHASSCVAEFLEVETPSSNRIPRRAPLLSNCRN